MTSYYLDVISEKGGEPKKVCAAHAFQQQPVTLERSLGGSRLAVSPTLDVWEPNRTKHGTNHQQQRYIFTRDIIHSRRGEVLVTVSFHKEQGHRLWCFMNITVSLHINVKSPRQMNFLIEYACRIDGLCRRFISHRLLSALHNEFWWLSGFQIGPLKNRCATIRFTLFSYTICPKKGDQMSNGHVI